MIRPASVSLTASFLWILAACVCFPVAVFAQADNLGLPESIRCDGSIIEAGDLQSKVLAKCGEPTDRVERKEYTVVHSRYITDSHGRYLLDRYVLDFTDPNLYKMEQDLLVRHVHDHSHFMGPFDRDETRTSFREPGRSVRRVLMRSLPGGLSRYRVSWHCSVTREDQVSEWVYNLGPTRFIRVLTFRNGRLLRIEMMGYGY